MKTSLTCSIFAVLLVLNSVSLAQDVAKKAPVPNDAAQAEAAKLIKEVYGDQYAKATTAAQKETIAEELLGKAKETQDDPAGKFVLLRLTRDIAAQAGDVLTALRAIDAMEEDFQVDAAEMKSAALAKIAPAAKSKAQHESIAEEALKPIDEAMAQNNFAVANQLGKLALAEARKCSEKYLILQAQDQIARVNEAAKAYEEVKAAEAILLKTPVDPAANLVVGKYRCFVNGDWDKGLAMLAMGNDETLKKLALEEIVGVVSHNEQVKLGDDWWSMAEKETGTTKTRMKARAGYWYRQALPGLSGMAKDKVDTRLKAISPTAAADEPPSGFVDLLSRVDLARDRVAGQWQKSNGGLSCPARQQNTWPLMMLPMIAHGGYDLAVSFTRLSGDSDVDIVLPVGSHSCLLVLSGWAGKSSGLGKIDGKAANNNATTISPGKLMNGKKYDLLVKVRLRDPSASVDVLLDGSQLVHWQGAQSSLSSDDTDFHVPQTQRFGLGTLQPTTFHTVRLKVVSGKAEWVK